MEIIRVFYCAFSIYSPILGLVWIYHIVTTFMKTRYTSLLFISALLLITSCKTKAPALSTTVELSPTQRVVLLDKREGMIEVAQDEMEGFFEIISPLDICIQMKKEPCFENRAEAVAAYRRFLRDDVAEFTSEEVKFTRSVILQMFKLTQEINPNLFPERMNLIKSNGAPYSGSAWYTRENAVVVPSDAYKEGRKDAFLQVMLHELFHIYSRLNPKKRKELYKLIGFTRLVRHKEMFQLHPLLQERMLMNPDGLDTNWAIRLDTSGRDEFISAVPLIVANEDSFKPEKPNFFDYIHFDLYPVDPPRSQLTRVLIDENAYSPIDLKGNPDFHRQIRDNTGYIIHPDEIMADNFALLVLSKRDPDVLKNLSPEGKKLIELIEAILKE